MTLDPRKVRGLLKTIQDFPGFGQVTVSDGETTVSVTKGNVAQVQASPGQAKSRKAMPPRSAISALGDLPPAGVYPEGV